ncbi:MAG: DUF6516 family protein [Usitatibacter sp.]
MVKAVLLFHYKAQQGNLVVEMVLWRLPMRSADKPHGIKYRLHLGRNGESLVRYDNEAGKGDHRHIGKDEIEESYLFSATENLLVDFRMECGRFGWRWDK